MLQRKILKSAFGLRYKIHTPHDGIHPANLNAEFFSDAISAYRFLRTLDANERFWLNLLAEFHDTPTRQHNKNPLLQLSQYLANNKFKIFEIHSPENLIHAADKRVLKSTNNEIFHFVSASEQLVLTNNETKDFTNATEASAFLNSLSPDDETLDAIIEVADINAQKKPKPNAVIPAASSNNLKLAQASQGLANGDVLVLVNKPVSPPSKDVLEETVNQPGNRDAGLGPKAAANKPKPSIRLSLSIWDTASKKDRNNSGAKWKMTKPVNKEGSGGQINVTVPKGSSSAAVKITWRDRTNSVKPAVNETPQENDYPQKIQHEQWKDVHANRAIPKVDDDIVEWNFSVVELASLDSPDGLITRMKNLGFAGGDKASVQTYQYIYQSQSAGSGVIGDIKADLIKRHDT